MMGKGTVSTDYAVILGTLIKPMPTTINWSAVPAHVFVASAACREQKVH